MFLIVRIFDRGIGIFFQIFCSLNECFLKTIDILTRTWHIFQIFFFLDMIVIQNSSMANKFRR